jgi:hypothetical protein
MQINLNLAIEVTAGVVSREQPRQTLSEVTDRPKLSQHKVVAAGHCKTNLRQNKFGPSSTMSLAVENAKCAVIYRNATKKKMFAIFASCGQKHVRSRSYCSGLASTAAVNPDCG